MKKEVALHLFSFAIFFVILTLLHKVFTPVMILFWLGGLVGTVLPDIDNLIYVFLLRPTELTSLRTKQHLSRRELLGAMDLLYSTRSERNKLIFHTIWFQILFLVVTYWVLVSTGNLFGRGVVLAFSLHLVIDQFIDLSKLGNLRTWLGDLPLDLTKEKATVYSVVVLLVVLLLALFF